MHIRFHKLHIFKKPKLIEQHICVHFILLRWVRAPPLHYCPDNETMKKRILWVHHWRKLLQWIHYVQYYSIENNNFSYIRFSYVRAPAVINLLPDKAVHELLQTTFRKDFHNHIRLRNRNGNYMNIEFPGDITIFR